jgi:hypothetical protein
MVLYRFENRDNIPLYTGSDKASNYSTTWINASYKVSTDKPFASSYWLASNTLNYGGLTSGTTSTTPSGGTDLNYTSNTLTISNLIYPAQETYPMYIYVSVGLPMDKDITFNSILCNTK